MKWECRNLTKHFSRFRPLFDCVQTCTHTCVWVCTVTSLLSLEGPYISLFRLLRESSPSLLHPSLLFFVFSPLDPANPPTHPLRVYTAAKGGLPMLEGLFFLAKLLIVSGARSQFLTTVLPPPLPKKNKSSFGLFALNLFFHLCHSSIWHLFLLVRPLSYPLLMHWRPFLPPKIPFIPFPSNPLPPTQNLPSSSPSSILTQSLLPLVSLQGSYSKPSPSSSLILSLCFITLFWILWIPTCFYFLLLCAYSSPLDVCILFIVSTLLTFLPQHLSVLCSFYWSSTQKHAFDLGSKDTCAVMCRKWLYSNKPCVFSHRWHVSTLHQTIRWARSPEESVLFLVIS